MGVYKASEAKSYEYQGADLFRIEKSGDRMQVVFLYDDNKSIDGYACHRLENASHYFFTLDCPRGPKDPVSMCPACTAGEKIATRLFVRVLDLSSGKVLIWDKPASFRKTIEGFMHYFTPLYKQKYEITREGAKLDTRYTFQSIGDSGIDEKKYKELLKQFDESVQNYVRPADKYEELKARVAQSFEEAVQEQPAQANPWAQNSQQNAWGQNPQQSNGWGAPPQSQNTGWGQSPQNNGWGSQPAPQQSAPAPTPAANQVPWEQNSAPQNPAPQQNTGWGQPPVGSWAQNPNTNQ